MCGSSYHKHFFSVLNLYPLHQDLSLMSLKVALLFWLSDTDLEGSLTLCPFREIIIHLEPVSSLIMSALLDFQSQAHFLLRDRTSVQSECGWLPS